MPDPVLVADRYEVIRPLGRGSFAHTLLARDNRLGRQVALKVLHPRGDHGLKAYELFEREAAVLRDLRHPGVPAIHTTFRAEWEGADAAFLVMEYIEGASLAEMIAERRHLELSEVINLFVELLGVLDYLHLRVPPVLHRDIKPANLIVRPDGTPVLVDFGAVRNVFRAPDDDGSTVVGTYGYMPYEQYMGQASPSSDLYALGATFLHLITGRAPPEFMSTAGRLEVPATLPCGEPLRGVLTRLLAPAQADRFQSAREVRSALVGGAAVTTQHGTSVVPVSPGGVKSSLAYREAPDSIALGPTPRPMTLENKALLRRVAYSPWELMNTQARGQQEFSFMDCVMLAFFSLITAGILPAIFFSIYFSRRKRFKRFVIGGIPGTATILDKQDEKIGFEEKLTRVRYEFEAGGRRRRGSEQVLPAIAEHWDPGDSIQILYMPDRDYDSVIISTT
jgi:serine/threonine protein kinase